MNGIIIRKARMDEAPQVAQLLMLAWPVEQILESNNITYEQLCEAVTAISAMEERAEALYSRLGFSYIDDKDFFGHKMKHMVKLIDITGQYYRHFKGNIYKVLYLAKHSETLEDIVVYQAMYGDRDVWVRPKIMFEEVIERDGKSFRRFGLIIAEEA